MADHNERMLSLLSFFGNLSPSGLRRVYNIAKIAKGGLPLSQIPVDRGRGSAPPILRKFPPNSVRRNGGAKALQVGRSVTDLQPADMSKEKGPTSRARSRG